MDALIRFCFKVEPESLEMDEYAKLYGQAKYAIDYANILQTKKVMNAIG